MKLVLGGGTRFKASQLGAVTTSVLYSDTVLVPDPVMPWLEKERTEETFQHVLLLQAVHALLYLKPLVDADLQYPAVMVFPSWEKTLEDKDEQTQKGISQLVADVFSCFLGEDLKTVEEVRDYADRNSDKFLSTVDANHLFVAPGGPLGEPLVDALARYKTEMRTWRSQEWLSLYESLPSQRCVLNGVFERLAPIYHLCENAEEFAGCPLMCLDQHAHYYKLVSATNCARLERLGVLNARTRALVDAMGSHRLRWLGGISIETLARLRKDNENVDFRKRLFDAIGRLHDSRLANVDNVASEICQELASAIAEHDKQARRIQEKYDHLHRQSAILAFGAAGAALIPSLAPFLGVAAPFALAAKYGHDKMKELAEKKALTRSLIGVLVTAKSEAS